MRKNTTVLLALGALLIAGCGATKQFANQPRPPVPVNLTVYIDNKSVSVSPATVGAGAVVFIVTNQAMNSQSLKIRPAGGGSSLADTGPISPQATAEVTVDLQPGSYTIGSGSGGSTDATLNGPATIRPASIKVGPARSNSTNVLLTP
jgi:hypothetical protein